jgi:hypothetical protein
MVFCACGLMDFALGPPQVGELSRFEVGLAQSLLGHENHKLSLRIPYQNSIHLHFLEPLGFQFFFKTINIYPDNPFPRIMNFPFQCS